MAAVRQTRHTLPGHSPSKENGDAVLCQRNILCFQPLRRFSCLSSPRFVILPSYRRTLLSPELAIPAALSSSSSCATQRRGDGRTWSRSPPYLRRKGRVLLMEIRIRVMAAALREESGAPMYDATRGANLSFGPLAKLGLNALSTPIIRAAISARATL